MSKKYVIEIKPEYEDNFKGLMLLGAKDSDLYVDTLAADNLEQYIPVDVEKIYDKAFSDGYKKGIEDGKASYDNGCEGCKWESQKGYDEPCKHCCNAYLNQYAPMPKDDSIKVGDEVRHKSHNTTWTAVVIRREEDVIYLMGHSGAVADYQLSGFEKTGRHFDIQPILEAMRT